MTDSVHLGWVMDVRTATGLTWYLVPHLQQSSIANPFIRRVHAPLIADNYESHETTTEE